MEERVVRVGCSGMGLCPSVEGGRGLWGIFFPLNFPACQNLDRSLRE